MNTKVRELKYSDRRKLSEMIKKLTKELGDESILKLISSSSSVNNGKSSDEKNDSQYIQLGFVLFKKLVEFLEDDIVEWFADLCGVDIQEFMNEAPFDIEIIVINQLFEDKGKIRSFLVGASKLYSTIRESVSKLSNQNEK